MSRDSEGKATILIVDDDPDMLHLLELRLKADGYQVKVSPNGTSMMNIITHSPPDLVLLDLQMNGIDGGTICRLLKTNPLTAWLPIVLFSANDNISNIARRCGADGYISKPYDPDTFKQIFTRILG